MLEILRIRQGRRAALTAIGPLMALAREADTATGTRRDWRSPYLLGFLTMAITLVALRAVPGLREGSLGAVQAGAWRRLTGEAPEGIGEDVCLLSSAADPDFAEGCHTAEMFLSMLVEPAAADPPAAEHARCGLGDLWMRCLDGAPPIPAGDGGA